MMFEEDEEAGGEDQEARGEDQSDPIFVR